MTLNDLGSAYLWGPQATGGATEIVTKEDVLDLVINIDPYDTPGVTLLPKSTANSTLHEWVTDTLSPTASNTAVLSSSSVNVGGWPEGADFDERDVLNRTRNTNITQIFRKDIKVSNTMRALNPFGVADEYSYQILKATREVARNMEVALWRQAESAGLSGTSATLARLWKSFEGLLTTNAAFARGTMLSNSATDSTSTAYPVREQDFNAMLNRIYTQGGDVDTVFVSPSVKRYVSSWGLGEAVNAAGGGGVVELQSNRGQVDRRLVRKIDVYESDFGMVQIVLDRWIPQGTATTITATATAAVGTANYATNAGRIFFLERARNRIAFLRPFRHVPLPPGGDNSRGIVVGEATIEALAEKGSGFIKLVSPIGN